MRHVLLAVISLGIATISGCGVGEREITVENCGEPIQISDCKWKGQLFSCVIENRSQGTYSGTPVWKYDAKGKLLDKDPYTYASGLKPGASTRQKLPVQKYNNDTTVKIVFCRKAPGQ